MKPNDEETTAMKDQNYAATKTTEIRLARRSPEYWRVTFDHPPLGVHMFRYLVTILVVILLSSPLVAGIAPFPASFHTQMLPTNGTSLYVRVGGKGPAVVLLHGFGDTGDMWAPLALVLPRDHTVIVPDLRGMGMSDHPDTGYTKKNRPLRDLGVSS